MFLFNCSYLYKFKIIIAATKPTIPASPSPWTKPTMLSATPPTNRTRPPRRETTIASASKDITILVKLLIVPEGNQTNHN